MNKYDFNEGIIEEVIKFTVHGKAVPKQSGKITTQYGKPRMYKDARVKRWEHDVMIQCLHHIPQTPFKCAILNLDFFYPWPKSWSKKKINWHKDNNFPYKITRPDRDNLHKNVADALGNKFWLDDSHIVDGRISKKYGDQYYVEIEIIGINYPY